MSTTCSRSNPTSKGVEKLSAFRKCQGVTNKGERCRYLAKVDGLCLRHKRQEKIKNQSLLSETDVFFSILSPNDCSIFRAQKDTLLSRVIFVYCARQNVDIFQLFVSLDGQSFQRALNIYGSLESLGIKNGTRIYTCVYKEKKMTGDS